MKKILLVLLLIVLAVVLCGCSQQERRVLSARIRYFDGAVDTVLIEKYSIGGGGTIRITTDSGREIVTGQNNIIVIDETEEQYNCQDY